MDMSKLLTMLKAIKNGKQSELNDIPKEMLEKYLAFMLKEGLIDGIRSTKDRYHGNPEITLKGIQFYEENKKSTKVYNAIKEIKDWIPGL